MTAREGAATVKRLAAELGFERCGIAAAGPTPHGDFYLDWLGSGQAGTMGYLHRHREERRDPRRLLPGARSVVVAALSYHQPEPPPDDDRPRGRVAMYAWGEDYHVVVREKLERLVARLRNELDEPFEAFLACDTSAIIEREWAMAAGVGWIGKNTLVLHPALGSYFFLGVVLTTLDLAPDPPATDHCGSCTRCLEACPTKAFPDAYRMDARRCISYLTIEHRGEIPLELRGDIGEWVFGCDVCQQVCPFNREAAMTREPRWAPRPPGARPALADILAWDDAAYEAATRGSASDRARPAMWRRNAEIVARNMGA